MLKFPKRPKFFDGFERRITLRHSVHTANLQHYIWCKTKHTRQNSYVCRNNNEQWEFIVPQHYAVILFLDICMCFYLQKSWTSATLTTLTPWSYLGMFICSPWLQESVVLSNLKMDFFLPSPSSPSPPSCPPAQEVRYIHFVWSTYKC